jgi:RNA polymerase sigma factor (sigma-70 family)
MVYGVCRALLRDPHDAEDATQQTFLSAYRALLGGTRVRDEGAWLATIARNECRARIAAGMRVPLPIPDGDLEAIPTTSDEAERSARVEELRSAIAELPERQREAVVLRHLYGLSYREVATALGLSRPATEALLFRARRSLRVRLRHAVTTAVAVPLAVQEGLAQAIPGFRAAGAGGVVAGAAGGGVLAKLASGPVAAKVAAATVAVTTVGTVGTIESERSGRDRAERGAMSISVGTHAESDGSGGRGTSGGSEDEGDDSGTSGRDGGHARDGNDNSGTGSSSSGPPADGRKIEDSSGSGGSGGDEGRSGSSGSGSDGGGGGEGPSEQGGSSGAPESEPDSESGSSGSGSGSSGSGSSGSGSSGSGSSGSGSGEDTAHVSGSSDSSGRGASSAEELSSSGSGSSGSGSSGSGGGDGADDPES